MESWNRKLKLNAKKKFLSNVAVMGTKALTRKFHITFEHWIANPSNAQAPYDKMV